MLGGEGCAGQTPAVTGTDPDRALFEVHSTHLMIAPSKAATFQAVPFLLFFSMVMQASPLWGDVCQLKTSAAEAQAFPGAWHLGRGNCSRAPNLWESRRL